MRLLTKFIELNRFQKAFVFKAFFLLAYYRVVILILPFDKIVKHMERLGSRPTSTDSEYDESFPREIGLAVSRTAAHTPWESKCLIQSLTAYHLLKSRHYPCTLSLGVAKDEKGKMVAHAWTQSGQIDVTGADIKDRYMVTYRFG